MTHGPLISAVDVGNFNNVYVCTGQQGLDESEGQPRTGIIVLSNNVQKVLSEGEMQQPRSMHKQAVIMNRIFITGGSTVNRNNKLNVATKSCEEITLSTDYNIMNAKMNKMHSGRRNHGICSVIKNNKMGILIGFGENDNREDNNKFE